MLHPRTLRFWKKSAFRNPDCLALALKAHRCLRWFLNSRHNFIFPGERQPLVFRFQYKSTPKYQLFQKDAGLNSRASHCVPSCIYRCKCLKGLQIHQVWFPNSDAHCQNLQFLIPIRTHRCLARFYKQSSLNSLSKRLRKSTYLNCAAFMIAIPSKIFLAEKNKLGPVGYVLLLKSFFCLQRKKFAHRINVLNDEILHNFFGFF